MLLVVWLNHINRFWNKFKWATSIRFQTLIKIQWFYTYPIFKNARPRALSLALSLVFTVFTFVTVRCIRFNFQANVNCIYCSHRNKNVRLCSVSARIQQSVFHAANAWIIGLQLGSRISWKSATNRRRKKWFTPFDLLLLA